eukprot:GHVS01058472.1.p2 GENE.GHVS01058472.1~~GHVS01058472.1.p2  ORF type:complete len:114 (-),score=20.40 GHVS01058472.1:1279-1620(-)
MSVPSSHDSTMEASRVDMPSKIDVGADTPQTPSTIASFPVQASTGTPSTVGRSPTQKGVADLDDAATPLQHYQGAAVKDGGEWAMPTRRLLPNASKPASKELLPFTELEAEYM